MKSIRFVLLVLKIAILFWTAFPVTGKTDDDFSNEIPKISSSGSCLAAGLCCNGKDSTCVVQRAPSNSIIENLEDIPCYCDHGCVPLQDCCHDFKHACSVQDCEVFGWGAWSSCDSECGQGTMTRSRIVKREARNGGKSCPSLVQKRGCRGTKCRHHKNKITLEDTAVLLPMEFSNKRKMNESFDITKNLRLRYPKDPEKEKSFPIQLHEQRCYPIHPKRQIIGSRLCIFCEQEAQKAYAGYRCSGTGTSNGISTRFSSLREPLCHGKWKHVSLGSSCSCDQGPSFIFV